MEKATYTEEELFSRMLGNVKDRFGELTPGTPYYFLYENGFGILMEDEVDHKLVTDFALVEDRQKVTPPYRCLVKEFASAREAFENSDICFTQEDLAEKMHNEVEETCGLEAGVFHYFFFENAIALFRKSPRKKDTDEVDFVRLDDERIATIKDVWI
jgi:hypothetical protein